MVSATRIGSLKQPAKQAVVFLHGLGDVGTSWGFLADYARQFSETPGSEFYGKFNHVRFVFPNAPVVPVSVNGGQRMPAWFDIFSLGGEVSGRLPADDIPGFLKSIEVIESVLEEVKQESGIESDKVVLGGFSQGAALSLASSVLLDKKVAGIVSLSGFLRVKETLDDKIKEVGVENLVNFDTPILHCHGDIDPVITYETAIATKEYYKQHLGLKGYKFLKYGGLAHSTTPEEITEVLRFFVKTLKLA